MVPTLLTHRSCFVLLLVLQCYHGQALAQVADVDGLTKYLQEKQVEARTIETITQHLAAARGKDLLAELIAWRKSGFPDQHDEHGSWKTAPSSWNLGIFQSILYCMGKVSPAERSRTYFSVLDQFRHDDERWYQLVQIAHQFLSEPDLKRETQNLMQSPDAKQRRQGVLMAQTLVAKDPSVKEQFIEMLQHDDSYQVRYTILYAVSNPAFSRREAGLLHIDRLVKDPSEQIRKGVAERLRHFTTTSYSAGLEVADLIVPMLSTEDPFVRITLGRLAADMSAGSSRTVDTGKFTDEFLKGFVRLARSTPRPGDPEKAKEALAQTWMQWWTPLIPAYSKSLRQVLESRDTWETRLETSIRVCEWIVLGSLTHVAPSSQPQREPCFAGTIEVKRCLKGTLESHSIEVELRIEIQSLEGDHIWFVRKRQPNGRYVITDRPWDKSVEGHTAAAVAWGDKKTRIPNMPKPASVTGPISISLAFDDCLGRALTRTQATTLDRRNLLIQFENHGRSPHSVSPELDGSSSGWRYPHYDLKIVGEKGMKEARSLVVGGCGNLNPLRTRDIIYLQPGEVFRTSDSMGCGLPPGTYRAPHLYGQTGRDVGGSSERSL